MKRWNVAHGKGGYGLHLDEVKWWLPPAEWLLDTACRLTDHRVCSGFRASIWDRVPVGRPKYDPEDPEWLTNSVNSVIWRAHHAMTVWLWQHGERRVGEWREFPLTLDQARRLKPAFVEDCERMFAEDEEIQP